MSTDTAAISVDTTTVDLMAGYAAPHTTATGGATSAMHRPDGYSLWLVTATLPAGGRLEWGTTHGDEALHVLEGELSVDGRLVGAGATVIVESSATMTIEAKADTRLLHFGPTDPQPPTTGIFGPPDPVGHGTHVIDPADVTEHVRTRDGGTMNVAYHADSTCPTCRATLIWDRVDGAYTVISHLHSEDELMYLIEGDVQMGSRTLTPGTVSAIPANYRYGFRIKDGCQFVTYRRDVGTATGRPGSEPILETNEALAASWHKPV